MHRTALHNVTNRDDRMMRVLCDRWFASCSTLKQEVLTL